MIALRFEVAEFDLLIAITCKSTNGCSYYHVRETIVAHRQWRQELLLQRVNQEETNGRKIVVTEAMDGVCQFYEMDEKERINGCYNLANNTTDLSSNAGPKPGWKRQFHLQLRAFGMQVSNQVY
jgi:hypothetical protein